MNNTEAVVTGGATASPSTPFVPLTGALTANDSPAGFVTAVAATVPTTAGGSVTIATDGTFKYTPPVTASALSSDTFQYNIASDSGGTGTPAVSLVAATLNLSGRVWYVKNNAAGGGNGQSQAPFNTLAAAQTASTAGDIIFVYDGDGTATGQNAGITLKNNQQLIGEAAGLTVNTFPLVPVGARPLITNSTANSDAVTLADGNTIKGLEIDSATRDGIAGASHAGFTSDNLFVQNNTGSGMHFTSMTGTITMTDTHLINNAVDLNVNNGTAAISFDSTNALHCGTGQSISIQNRPALAGTINIGANFDDDGSGMLINNNASGIINFTGKQQFFTTTNTAVTMTSNTGTTINFSGDLEITTTTGTGFSASGGGTLSVSGIANVITGAATNGVNISGMTVGGAGIAFDDVETTGAATGINIANVGGAVTIKGGDLENGTTGISLTGASTTLNLGTTNTLTINGPTTGISASTFGTLAITNGNVSVSGVTALNLSGGAVSGQFSSVSSSGGTNGVNLSGVTGTWSTVGGTLTGATGSTFNVSGGGGGTITWGASITQGNGGNVVTIASSNSNTITFNGNVQTSGTSTGINISGSSGTYNFNGVSNTIAGSGGGITIGSGESGTISFNSATSITGGVTAFQVNGNPTAVTAAITYSGTINKTSAGQMISIDNLDNPGTLTMTHAGAGSLTQSTAASGISVTNSSSTNITISNATVNFANAAEGFTGSGNTSGTITLNGIALIGNGSKDGMLISGAGTINVGIGAAAPSINMTGSTANAIDGTTTAYTGTLNLNSVAITGGGATAVTLGNAGTGGTLGGAGSTITNAGPALVLSGVTLTSGAGMTSISSNAGANGISLTSISGGTYTIGGGSLTGNTGTAFLVSTSSANFTYSGSITQNTAGQKAVAISGVTAGTITLGGSIGSNGGTGVSVAGTGGTVTINGDMTLNNASSVFSASGPGLTINVTGANNTVGATNAATTTGVSITNATIGASNVTFKSVSVTGGSKGIILNSTGSSGTFSVTGVGTTAGSGGTIQNTSSNGIELTSANNVTLRNMNLTNDAQTQTTSAVNCGNPVSPPIDPSICVADLFMNAVSGITLNNLDVSGSNQMGIAGKAVAGLSLVNSTIHDNGDELYENGLFFKDLSGTVSITGTTVKDNFTRQSDIENYAGSMTLTASGSLFGRVSTVPGVNSDQGFFVLLANSAHADIDMGTSTIQNNGNGNGLQINLQNSSTLGSSGTHSSMHNMTLLTGNAAHVFVNTASTATAFFDTLNNAVMTGAGLQSIDYFAPAGSLTGIIQGNTIGTSGVTASGCSGLLNGCDGMTIDQSGTGALSLRIQSNTIQQINTNGIAMGATNTGSLNASIINNTIRQPSNGAAINSQGNALWLNIGANSGSTVSACLNITGNSISDTSATQTWDINGSDAAIYLNTKNTTTTHLPGMAGSGAPAAQTFIGGNNTFTLAGASPVLASTLSGSVITGGAACSVP